MIVEMGKEYRFSDGTPYRLLCTDAGGAYPIIGIFYDARGQKWLPCSHTKDGLFAVAEHKRVENLVEVKPRIKGEFWLAHLSREQVVALTEYPCATHTVWNVEPIAITHHTYDCEHGEGLK